MHTKQHYFPRNPALPLANQMCGYYTSEDPTKPFFGGTILPPSIKPSVPFHGVDFQPSEACPRNFVIFDQTNNRSQIMFHPEIGSNFHYPGFGVGASNCGCLDDDGRKDTDERVRSSLKEDSDDINDLLSTEYEENEEYDDDEVSTARTDANYECNSPDSYSNYESPSGKSGSSSFKKSSYSYSDKKRKKMRKMVKALRGIVPGANRMSTVAVLDEAVRYLKSLRVQVQEMGVGNSKS